MKKLSILFVMLGFIAIAPQAFAQDGTSDESSNRFEAMKEEREDLREKMHEEREKLRGQVEDKRDSLRDLRDEKKEQVEKFKTDRKGILHEMMKKKLEKRLTAGVERMKKLAERIQSRIDKVKAAGGVVTTVETHMAEAKTAYDGALAKIATLVKPTAENQNVVETNKATIEAIKADLKNAHTHLIEAVKELAKIKSALESTNNSSDDSNND